MVRCCDHFYGIRGHKRWRLSCANWPAETESKPLPPYKSLATKLGQPYSFSRKQLLGKQADLGPSRFSALYHQQPQSEEDQLFPENVWRTFDSLPIEDLHLVVSTWIVPTRPGRRMTTPPTLPRLQDGGTEIYEGRRIGRVGIGIVREIDQCRRICGWNFA